jgi:hypothetical protein
LNILYCREGEPQLRCDLASEPDAQQAGERCPGLGRSLLFRAITCAGPYADAMVFTAIHRALGVAPGPLTNDLLDAAVTAGVTETDDLDWKSALPPAKGVPNTDFPKDVAAMANSGGGLIVFGVDEEQKAATGRVDVGEVSEAYERTLRSAAITAISPPVFGLGIDTVTSPEGKRAVIVQVPASVDGPHLIYRGEYFGAPIRNNADTVWMKERQIEAEYRARFDERRHSQEALDGLYKETAIGRDIEARAWLIGVARPRVPRLGFQMARDEARTVLREAGGLCLLYAGSGGIHPLESVERSNPRPGLRRWVCANSATSEGTRWREAWTSIHHDGSVTMAAAIGAHRFPTQGGGKGWQIDSSAIECSVADLMALVRANGNATRSDEYSVRVGIEWAAVAPPLSFYTTHHGFFSDDESIPLHRFTPVETSVNAQEPDLEFYWHVHDFALDCLNQGGLANVSLINPPDRDA